MVSYELWARSLHHHQLNKGVSMCSWSDKYQTTIHRFAMGERRCQCKKVVVEQKVTSGGWKRIPSDRSDPTTKASKRSKTGHG